MQENGKLTYIENMRCVALVLIVMIHVVAYPIQNWNDSSFYFILYSLGYAIGCCGVPIFLLISGSLLFNPDKEISVRKIYTKMIPRILLPLCIFGYVFALMEMYFETHSVSLAMFIGAAERVLNKESWDHLWYLYMLLGLYMFLPVLQFLNKNLDEKQYRYFTALLIGLGYILPTINSIFGTSINVNQPSPLCHIAALWLGGAMVRYEHSEQFKKLVSLCGVCSLFVLIATGLLCPIYFGRDTYTVIASYNDIFVIGTAMLLYLLIKKVSSSKMGGLGNLAECSFGIYLIHPVVMNILYKVLDLRPDYYFALISIPLFTVAFIIPSWLCVAVMKKIPLVKKLV